MLRRLYLPLLFSLLSFWSLPLIGQAQSTAKPKPRVVVIGVNGMELDVIRPLLLQGKMPNLSSVIKKGAYGKLRTVSAPNCPRVYSTLFTSTKPEEHGVTGFIVGGITANTNMLKEEPIWSMLSKAGVTVGMANVPATFPVLPVNGYMISGMLTRGKNCEDGVLCAPKLSEVEGGDVIRDEQTQLFDYLLDHHPTDFTWLGQSCEDRTGHWLYPIAPYNAGYNPKINAVRTEAFPDQYVAFDKVLGAVLKHIDDNTYVIVVSDHGIKPLREFEETDPHAHMDHEKTTPVVAKHDFADGDDVPGSFFAMGPGIKRDLRLMGFEASVYDIAPTILHIYGIEQPAQMRGHVLTEIFDGSDSKLAQK
jgi:predicted AlkP superfamily phosphohydrolase/phosphomutase